MLIFLNLPSARRNVVVVWYWENSDPSGSQPDLRDVLRATWCVLTLGLLFFSEQSSIRKNCLRPAKNEMSTPAGAPPDPGDGFYSHISCCPGKSICGVSCPPNIGIPVMGLALGPSGLDPGSDGCGMDLVAAKHNDTPQNVASIQSTLVSHHHLFWSLNVSISNFSLPFW